MATFLTIIGLIVAVVVFLNLLSAKQSLKDGSSKNGVEQRRGRVNVKKVLEKKEESSHFPLRICPVCGTVLEQEDYLIAALGMEPGESGKREAQIYGCRYCYATDGVNLEHGKLTKIEP